MDGFFTHPRLRGGPGAMRPLSRACARFAWRKPCDINARQILRANLGGRLVFAFILSPPGVAADAPNTAFSVIRASRLGKPPPTRLHLKPNPRRPAFRIRPRRAGPHLHRGETMQENTGTSGGPAAKARYALAAPMLPDAAALQLLPRQPGEPQWQEK